MHHKQPPLICNIDSAISTFPYLPLTEFCFVYKARSKILIPPFPGKLLHGAFGNALFKNVCRVPGSDCKACMFKKRCAYATLFKSQYALKTGHIKNLNNVPAPHIFRFHNQGIINIPANSEFSLQMVLLGKASEQVDELFSAMKALGENGIHNKQAQITAIKQLSCENSLPRYIAHSNDISLPECPVIPDVPEKVRVEFLTPYIQTGARQGQAFSIQYWLMGIIRRIAILQTVYSSLENNSDFVYLKKLSLMANTSEDELYFYKTSQTEKTYTSGYLGRIDLKMKDIEDLWPWLYLGQWVNCGKKTSHGYGRYSLMSV